MQLTEIEEGILERIKDCLAPTVNYAKLILKAMEEIEAGHIDSDLENVDVMRLEVRCEHLELDLADVVDYLFGGVIGTG